MSQTPPRERTRKYRQKRFAEIDAMPKIPCACGCGELIPPINRKLQPAKYKQGHGPGSPETRFNPGMEPWNKGKKGIPGHVHTPEEIERYRATRHANFLVNGNKRGWKHKPESIEKMREAQKVAAPLHALRGPDNPFYGKRHTQEAREKMSAKLRKDKHPHWRGGVGTLPYGPEFTRKFKRLIRERDGNVCQRCGKTREQNGRTLQIHHIDHNKMNNDPSNLVTVCNSCNVWCSFHRDEPFERDKR